MKSTPVRLCVLEDHRITRAIPKELRKLGFEVQLAHHHPVRFFSRLDALVPQVGLVDVCHPSADRLQALGRLSRRHPTMRVVAVVASAQRDLTRRCRALGAWRCVHQSLIGKRRLGPLIRAGARARPELLSRAGDANLLRSLTPKEREVLALVADGADNLKIAAMLSIAERTVKVHVTSIYRKLRAQNRVELALLARGLLAV
jgi:two-component system nitrate/nitrite response regulator NarL